MKKLFLLAWPIALAAVSCSNEEVVSVNNDANEIKFTAVANNATRANTTETFCNYALPSSFDVWAMTGTKSYFEKVTYTEASGEWKAPAENVRFWPNEGAEALDFYAMRNYGTPTWTPDGTAKMTTVFTVEDLVANQKDFIYAVATGQKSPATTEKPHNGVVALNFRHALSQIVFMAKNTNKNLAVEITNVEVINVYNGGTCTLPTTTTKDNYEDHAGTGVTDPTPTCTWSDLTGQGKDYSVATETCKMVGITDDAVNLTNGKDKKESDVVTRNLDKAMLLIPQTTTGATLSPTSTPSTVKAAEDGGSMIAVTCKIWNLNTDSSLNESTDVVLYDGVAYIPFSATWDSGKKYIYTLVFGKANGGYDENGKDILVPISFTVTVDDFTTVVENDVNVNI